MFVAGQAAISMRHSSSASNAIVFGSTVLCADGTLPLSFVHGLEPFARDNIRWVRGKDSPAIGKGIHALYRDWETDRKSTRLNSSHSAKSRMPSSA